jgi:hypothetical protein
MEFIKYQKSAWNQANVSIGAAGRPSGALWFWKIHQNRWKSMKSMKINENL